MGGWIGPGRSCLGYPSVQVSFNAPPSYRGIKSRRYTIYTHIHTSLSHSLFRLLLVLREQQLLAAMKHRVDIDWMQLQCNDSRVLVQCTITTTTTPTTFHISFFNFFIPSAQAEQVQGIEAEKQRVWKGIITATQNEAQQAMPHCEKVAGQIKEWYGTLVALLPPLFTKITQARETCIHIPHGWRKTKVGTQLKSGTRDINQ